MLRHLSFRSKKPNILIEYIKLPLNSNKISACIASGYDINYVDQEGNGILHNLFLAHNNILKEYDDPEVRKEILEDLSKTFNLIINEGFDLFGLKNSQNKIGETSLMLLEKIALNSQEEFEKIAEIFDFYHFHVDPKKIEYLKLKDSESKTAFFYMLSSSNLSRLAYFNNYLDNKIDPSIPSSNTSNILKEFCLKVLKVDDKDLKDQHLEMLKSLIKYYKDDFTKYNTNFFEISNDSFKYTDNLLGSIIHMIYNDDSVKNSNYFDNLKEIFSILLDDKADLHLSDKDFHIIIDKVKKYPEIKDLLENHKMKRHQYPKPMFPKKNISGRVELKCGIGPVSSEKRR